MKIPGILTIATCIAGLAVGTVQSARASEVIYDGIGFMMGQQSGQDSFAVNGPGTLTVTLSDFAWPVAMSSLDLVVSTPQGVLGPETGAGTSTYTIAAAENISANWFGAAQGTLDVGVYGLKVEFAPVTAVPLPTSIALLISGLALLGWQRRDRFRTARMTVN